MEKNENNITLSGNNLKKFDNLWKNFINTKFTNNRKLASNRIVNKEIILKILIKTYNIDITKPIKDIKIGKQDNYYCLFIDGNKKERFLCIDTGVYITEVDKVGSPVLYSIKDSKNKKVT